MFEDSIIYTNQPPNTVYERILAFKDLLFSKTRLEFRLIWRRIFQTDDQEVEWLLDPHRSDREANLLASFNRNYEDGYQCSYDHVRAQFGHEKVTIYNRGVARKSDTMKSHKPKPTMKENALTIARYMGMGVYMTSSAFPSPFPPFSDQHIFDATLEGRNIYEFRSMGHLTSWSMGLDFNRESMSSISLSFHSRRRICQTPSPNEAMGKARRKYLIKLRLGPLNEVVIVLMAPLDVVLLYPLLSRQGDLPLMWAKAQVSGAILMVQQCELLETMAANNARVTFAIIKPDVASNRYARESILTAIKSDGFKIIAMKKTRLSLDRAKQFYGEHQEKFFYNRLILFMSSSPVYAMLLAKNDAINSWRLLIGKTFVYRTIYTDPECLRSKFGLTDTRNAMHGSDSEATVRREASFFFPNLDELINNNTNNVDH